MSKQSAMEYCRLNLQRCGLKPEGGDQEKINQLENHFQTVKSAEAASAEMKKEAIGKTFHYENMGLLYWAVVCLALLALPMEIGDHLQDGIILQNPDLLWPVYVLPAVVLGVRVYFGSSMINIVHIALAAVCALLTFLKIRIFGSEVNWIWVFIVVGTIITIIGRIWEHNTVVGPNLKWHNDLRQKILEGEKAIGNAASVFSSVGSVAEQQLRSQFPGADLPARKTWFAFDREAEKGTPAKTKLTEVNTDFETKKHDYHDRFGDSQSTTIRVAEVSDQKLDFELIDRETAMRYIQEKKMSPFFGLSEPAEKEDLCYMAYVHRWSEARHDVIYVNYDKTDYTYTGEKTRAKREMEDKEWSALGLNAEDFMMHTDSTVTAEATRQYISRRDAKLNELSDYKARERHVEYTAERNDNVTFDHIATITVTTRDGEPVALYCADSRQAIDFAEKMAKDYWGAGITAGCIPQSNAQAAYLYQRYFS